MSTTTIDPVTETHKEVHQIPSATVRFAGDSGDGMQLTGEQFTRTSALLGNDVSTFPDFPAEIRAPRGTLAGVSGFQVHFSSTDIYTPGDALDALVVMNPAALKTNLSDLRKGGILIANLDNFQKKDYEMAGYDANPLDSEVLEHTYQLFKVPMSKLVETALKGSPLTTKEKDRCKNFFALGLVYWLYGRDLAPTIRYVNEKFATKPDIIDANITALKAGWNYGETTDAFASSYKVGKAKLPPGTYKNISGNIAMAWGLMTAARQSGKDLFLGSYPITPQRHSARAVEVQKLRRANFTGRGRNCCHLLGDRRCLRRPHGNYHIQRPWHRAQGRSNRPGDHARAAAPRYQHSTRRPEHRPADEN